jgi:hypothetical protein
MKRSTTDALDDHAKVRCLDCGADIWQYTAPSGHHVALEDAPGPWIIEGTKAYESVGSDGYRNHWDHCHTIARSLLTRPAIGDEFLWA